MSPTCTSRGFTCVCVGLEVGSGLKSSDQRSSILAPVPDSPSFVLFYAPGMAPTQLSSAALSDLDDVVSPPNYDRSALTPSIVHIGVGGFHLSHLATYVDELCRAGHTDWAIHGAGAIPGA